MVAHRRGEMPLYRKTHKNNSNALIRKNFTAEMPLYAPIAGVHNAPIRLQMPLYARLPFRAPAQMPLCPQMPRERGRGKMPLPVRRGKQPACL